jgi:uncharacterized protein YkwD
VIGGALNSLAAGGLALGLTLAGCSPAPPVTFGGWEPTIEATAEIAALERELFGLLNRDRAAQGLPALRYDERLADVARAHSLDMRDHDFFTHQSSTTGLLEDRIDRAGYLATEMRENLAIAANPTRAAHNLMESPGHRANILAESVTQVGVGIVRGNAEGDRRVLTITQVFAKPAKLDTPDEAAAQVRKAMGQARKQAGLPPLAAHALLDELAAQHIVELPDDVPSSAVDDIGDLIAAQLNEQPGHGLAAVGIAAQGLFSAGDLPVPPAATDPAVRHLGLASAAARDKRGRPRVKLLILFGRVPH